MNVPIDVNKSNLMAIIILNWNGSDDTAACTSSVLRAGPNPDDIFIVDNGSSDGSISILSKKFPQIKNILALDNNRGFAGGMNFGLRKAVEMGYQYALLLNNDTLIIQPGVIGAYLSALQINDNVAVVSPRIVNNKNGTGEQKDLIVDSKGLKQLGYRFLYPPYSGSWDRNIQRTENDLILEEVLMLHGVAIAVKLKALQETGYFNDDFFCTEEDRDLMIRVRASGYKLLKIVNYWIYHRWSGTNLINSSFSIYHKTRNLWYMRNRYHSKRYIIFSYFKLFLVSMKNGQIKAFIKGLRDAFRGTIGQGVKHVE